MRKSYEIVVFHADEVCKQILWEIKLDLVLARALKFSFRSVSQHIDFWVIQLLKEKNSYFNWMLALDRELKLLIVLAKDHSSDPNRVCSGDLYSVRIFVFVI